MIIKCPECGHQVSDQAKTCPSCGIDIAGKITRCPDCGEVIFKEQGQCPNCHCVINGASATARGGLRPSGRVPVAPPAGGAEEQATPQPPSRKKRVGLVVLAISLTIALVAVFSALYFMKNQERQNEQRAYDNAALSSEPLVLQNFLDMYVDAPKAHRDTIMAHLSALKKVDGDWRDALVNNSKYGYEQFMKQHPQSSHNVEAAVKIDSLDWAEALKANTVEAFRQYMSAHSDGAYYDEAQASYERLEAQKVTPEDRLLVSQLFTAYFTALAQMDVEALSATLAPVLTSFLHRANATQEDVFRYMRQLHEDDITRMEFIPNGDWSVEKSDLGDGRYALTASFSVVQRMERTDESRPTSTVFKVTAQVSPEGRISELNMKRSVQ